MAKQIVKFTKNFASTFDLFPYWKSTLLWIFSDWNISIKAFSSFENQKFLKKTSVACMTCNSTSGCNVPISTIFSGSFAKWSDFKCLVGVGKSVASWARSSTVTVVFQSNHVCTNTGKLENITIVHKDNLGVSYLHGLSMLPKFMIASTTHIYAKAKFFKQVFFPWNIFFLPKQLSLGFIFGVLCCVTRVRRVAPQHRNSTVKRRKGSV